MSGKAFRFSLQPALDAAMDEQAQWEKSIAQTRREIAAEEDRLAKWKQEMQHLMQHLDRASDNLADVDALPRDFVRLSAAAAGLKAMRNRLIRQEQSIAQQNRVIHEIELKLNLQEENLRQIWSKVKSMERLRDRQKQEFHAELERAEQDDIDEAAIQRFNRE